jgi:transcriptional regulator with XRE-family HTH domain
MHFITATTEEILSQIAARLRSQRLAQSLPQSELALMAGLSLGAVRKLESTGQCSLDTFVRVAQALGLIAELEPVFASQPTSIADMQRAAKAKLRRRAPRRLQ